MVRARSPASARPRQHHRRLTLLAVGTAVASVSGISVGSSDPSASHRWLQRQAPQQQIQPYGRFPQPDDPFRFLPCTNATLPPLLTDEHPQDSWDALFEPDPAYWSWGNATTDAKSPPSPPSDDDPYAGRGLYLCGYLDVPLDWTNATLDTRIARLAVTKYLAGGPRVGRSERTIVVEPGGPGGSGTAYAWRGAEKVSQRFSDGRFDVLGWDPRGVNASQPAASCYPFDAYRDRWTMLTRRYREEGLSADGSQADHQADHQLRTADAMNEAILRACALHLGDIGRFVNTGQVVRDLDAIRDALGEPELTGYLVSYGTGIGQTYAAMFPTRIGRVILDGTEFVPDEWQLGGFGWAALDNTTDAWHDGFLGGCLEAGPALCHLATGDAHETLDQLEARMAALLARIRERPAVGFSPRSGPSVITYSALVASIYSALYQPRTWPGMAQMLADLERGNTTLAAMKMDSFLWEYDPYASLQLPPGAPSPRPLPPSTDELMPLVICSDAYDDRPDLSFPSASAASASDDGLAWWDNLWANMTQQSWVAGNSRFYNVLPCRHYSTFWPEPAGVYHGPLRHADQANPVLLIAETYDPATPLRNGRRLAAALGHDNARLIVHHGFGHASAADPSDCTDANARALILDGIIPDADETDCYANEKPYLYGISNGSSPSKRSPEEHDAIWRDHMREMMILNPGLVHQRDRLS